MAKAKNILFIMCDQLRWDYLSCYGHPALHTPHIDSLAAQGVRFDRAYTQAPICGPSRMSFYTGRYVSTHGTRWNPDPLKAGELGMGDYLRPLGMRTVLAGKSHVRQDREGLARLGIDPDSEHGISLGQAGFEVFERDDGLHPNPIVRPDLRYNQYLRSKGYGGDNPWNDHANAAVDEAGNVLDGWRLRHAVYPANIAEEDSETPYMTGRAIEFLQSCGDQPWCLHLSYIKPHWPYIVPAPYHQLYSADDILPANRSEQERQNAHPVHEALMRMPISRNFSREEKRRTVIPAYMGLVKQIDDQIGRLLAFLDSNDLRRETMIVFTSDHGDYLGDHWLGEKDLFHEESVRIPLIIVDPSSEADATRGKVESRFVEAIDLLPTYLDVAGGEIQRHRLEGRSLLPLLHGREACGWREFAISETDYTGRDAMTILQLEPQDCRAYMVRNEQWKYIYHEKIRSQLYNMREDPGEHTDLGTDPAYEKVRQGLKEILFDWTRRRKLRTTMSYKDIREKLGPAADERDGFYIGRW